VKQALTDQPRIQDAARYLARVPEIPRCVAGTAHWPTLIPACLRLRNLDYPWVFTTRAGDRVLLQEYGDLTTVWRIFFAREYLVPRNCRTIVDLGANIGAFAIHAARLAPEARIHCVEPFPSTFGHLQENLRLNALNDRITAVNCAVAGSTGQMEMDARPEVPGHQRHAIRINAYKKITQSVTVPMVTLQESLDAAGFRSVDLLKADIEGSEYEMIDAASDETLRRCRRICMEWHSNRPFAALRDRLESCGFRCVRKTRDAPAGQAAFVLEESE